MNTNSAKKIRVMHLASNPEWAGAEVHIAALADSLKSDDRVELSVSLFHEGRLADYLKKQGVKTNVVTLSWLFDIASIFKITKLLKAQNIEILHTHGYKANFIGALASCFHKETKCLRTEHGLTEPFFGLNKIKMNLYETLDYLAGRFLTEKIITVSHDIKNHMKNRYDPGKVLTIHNGLSTEESGRTDAVKVKESLCVPKDAFVIGIMGRLVPVKGHQYFINAAKLILKKRRDVCFLIVGDGPLRQELKSSVPENLSEYIKFAGFRNDARDIMSIMDIVVFSSLSEGIPYTLLEAMSEKKAIVAARVGGLVEVISDGKNGLLVDSKDEAQIAEKCLYLLKNNEITKILGEEAKKTVRNNFSAKKMKEETINIYEEILA